MLALDARAAFGMDAAWKNFMSQVYNREVVHCRKHRDIKNTSVNQNVCLTYPTTSSEQFFIGTQLAKIAHVPFNFLSLSCNVHMFHVFKSTYAIF